MMPNLLSEEASFHKEIMYTQLQIGKKRFRYVIKHWRFFVIMFCSYVLAAAFFIYQELYSEEEKVLLKICRYSFHSFTQIIIATV